MVDGCVFIDCIFSSVASPNIVLVFKGSDGTEVYGEIAATDEVKGSGRWIIKVSCIFVGCGDEISMFPAILSYYIFSIHSGSGGGAHRCGRVRNEWRLHWG